MRQIKFRAWDDGKMVYEKDIQHLSLIDEPVLRLAKFWCNIRNDSKVMQFTGLKDRNGVEIYEGDILKESEYGIFEVVWDSKWGKFKLDCNRVCNYIQYPAWNRGVLMEVIGNIYEHHNLLTNE